MNRHRRVASGFDKNLSKYMQQIEKIFDDQTIPPLDRQYFQNINLKSQKNTTQKTQKKIPNNYSQFVHYKPLFLKQHSLKKTKAHSTYTSIRTQPTQSYIDSVQKSEMYLKIYQEKCKNLHINPSIQQANRFIQRIQRKLNNQFSIQLTNEQFNQQAILMLFQTINQPVRLYLSGNKMGHMSLQFYKRWQSLVQLQVCNCSLTENLMEVLLQNLPPYLGNLDLSNNSQINSNYFTKKNLKQLRRYLHQNVYLAFLKLNGLRLSEHLSQILLILQNTQIQGLWIRNNSIVKLNCSKIKVKILDLSQNRIDNQAMKTLNQVYMFYKICYKSNLIVLNLSSNHLTSYSLYHLFIYPTRLATIRKLYLDNNNFSNNQISNFQRFFNAKLQFNILSLISCSLTKKDCEYLVGLDKCLGLRRLDISRNNIGSEGFICLQKSLFNLRIEQLLFSKCNIDNDAIESIKHLLTHRTLLYLDLSINLLTPQNVSLIPECCTLLNINLQSNFFSPSVLAELKRQLKEKRQVEKAKEIITMNQTLKKISRRQKQQNQKKILVIKLQNAKLRDKLIKLKQGCKCQKQFVKIEQKIQEQHQDKMKIYTLNIKNLMDQLQAYNQQIGELKKSINNQMNKMQSRYSQIRAYKKG